jgi:hypothetical protein
MDTQVNAYRGASRVLALLTVALGVALLVVTTVHGGGAVGYLLGVLFVVAGAGRLYLNRERAR